MYEISDKIKKKRDRNGLAFWMRAVSYLQYFGSSDLPNERIREALRLLR